MGASTLYGIEIKGIDSLQDCIKKCVTAGNGIAAQDDQVGDAVGGIQICCNIDYDFATHKCFQHPCINKLITNLFCIGDNIEAPVNSVRNPSVITITFCKKLIIIFSTLEQILCTNALLAHTFGPCKNAQREIITLK